MTLTLERRLPWESCPQSPPQGHSWGHWGFGELSSTGGAGEGIPWGHPLGAASPRMGRGGGCSAVPPSAYAHTLLTVFSCLFFSLKNISFGPPQVLLLDSSRL